MRLVLLLWLVAGCQANEQKLDPNAPADCERVGTLLAGYEMGTAAPKEKLAPAATRYRDNCQSAHVTQAELQCLTTANTTWKAKECVPSMFQGAHAGGDCKLVAQRMKEAVMAVGSGGAAIEKLLPAIEVSCEQDAWPTQMKQCVLTAKLDELGKCNGMLSKELQDKMARRMLILTQHQPGSAAQ